LRRTNTNGIHNQMQTLVRRRRRRRRRRRFPRERENY
jgi:hypothetical protein